MADIESNKIIVTDESKIVDENIPAGTIVIGFGDGEEPEPTEDYIYYCNGVNDNEILSQMSKDFYNSNVLSNFMSLKITIIGVVGITSSPITGAYSLNNPSRFFDFGISAYSGNRRLYLDFSNATINEKIITVPVNNSYISLFYNNGSYIKYEKLNASITLNDTTYGAYVYCNGGSNCVISNSRLKANCLSGGGYANSASNSHIISSELQGTGKYAMGVVTVSAANSGANCIIQDCILKADSNYQSAGNTASDCIISNCRFDISLMASANYATGNSGSRCNISNCIINVNAIGGQAYGIAGNYIRVNNSVINVVSNANGSSAYAFNGGQSIFVNNSYIYALNKNTNQGTACGFANCSGVRVSNTFIAVFRDNNNNSFYSYGANVLATQDLFDNCEICVGSTDGTSGGVNCVGIKNNGTSATTAISITSCIFPCITSYAGKSYNQNTSSVAAIDIGTSSNIMCNITGNIIHIAFTAIVAPPITTNKVNVSNNMFPSMLRSVVV